MEIELVRTAYPRKIDYDRIAKVKDQLKKENSTSEEKIKEIFDEIGIDFDLNRLELI